MRRLQGGIAELTRLQNLRVKEEPPSSGSPEVTRRLVQLEEGLRNQQRAYDQLREDNVEDARSIKGYLDQVHEMVTSLLRRQHDLPPAEPEAVQSQMTKMTSASQKGDVKVEVQDSGFCRVGEIVLVGGKEARTVISEGGRIFRVPLEDDCVEGTTIRSLRDNEFLQM